MHGTNDGPVHTTTMHGTNGTPVHTTAIHSTQQPTTQCYYSSNNASSAHFSFHPFVSLSHPQSTTPTASPIKSEQHYQPPNNRNQQPSDTDSISDSPFAGSFDERDAEAPKPHPETNPISNATLNVDPTQAPASNDDDNNDDVPAAGGDNIDQQENNDDVDDYYDDADDNADGPPSSPNDSSTSIYNACTVTPQPEAPSPQSLPSLETPTRPSGPLNPVHNVPFQFRAQGSMTEASAELMFQDAKTSDVNGPIQVCNHPLCVRTSASLAAFSLNCLRAAVDVQQRLRDIIAFHIDPTLHQTKVRNV